MNSRLYMTKEQLIQKITAAFKDVRLEDGTGLWEAQGIDDYASPDELAALREKDEKEHWQHIPADALRRCSSSISFFDAKGMRFHLPLFLIDQIDEPESLLFHLETDSDYTAEQFSLLNQEQVQCVIDYLDFFQQKIIERYATYTAEYGSTAEAVYSDTAYRDLQKAKELWQRRIKGDL